MVFSLGADKASGLDGFNMQFYQHFWPMLHQDFIDTLQAFFDGHLELSRFNRDYISLMPKISGARNIGDFKPISLINSIFKIISKFLALQLEKKIGDLIDPAQSAFIHGRSILDSVASAQEIIFACSKHNWSGYLLKLDFAKAFDMMNWNFIIKVLKARVL